MSRYAAALREVLATVGINTPQKAFVALIAAITSIIVAYPAELWGKVITAAAWLIVLLILYFWNLRTLPHEAIKVVLSPLYTAVGRKQFRSEQRAKDDEIARLSSESRRLAAEMAKLDITTDDGQRKLKELAAQKKPIDQKMAELEKLPKPRLGYIAGD